MSRLVAPDGVTARRRRVVIAGGGITALATAHALASASPDIDVVIVERAPRLGGNLITTKKDGFLLDGGPDSWVATKPEASALATKLGLGGEMVGTIEKNRRVYIAWGDSLHPLPEGAVLGVPTEVMPLARSRLFSWGGKLRMGLEPFVRRRALDGDDDESIAHFVTRRLGRQATERLAGPLLGGIYAGEAELLSVRAAMPQFVAAEKKFGSLVLAMRAQRRAARGKGSATSTFLSLKNGIAGLVDALATRLTGASVRTGMAVRKVSRLAPGDLRGRYSVDVEGGEALIADDVVLAVPGHAAAHALRALDGELGALLDGMTYASTATVFLAFRRGDVAHPLDAAGYIVPRSLGQPILAATWVSSKWEGRAPEGSVLVRAFVGGSGREEVLAGDDDTLARLAFDAIKRTIGATSAPLFSKVFRFTRASPQPLVGHLTRMREVSERLAAIPGVHVAGSGYDGVGIPDCIRQAQAVARAIIDSWVAPAR